MNREKYTRFLLVCKLEIGSGLVVTYWFQIIFVLHSVTPSYHPHLQYAFYDQAKFRLYKNKSSIYSRKELHNLLQNPGNSENKWNKCRKYVLHHKKTPTDGKGKEEEERK